MPDKKRPTPLDWEDVRFFAALAHRRTLAAAAQALGVPRAMVVRRLAHLVTAMGGPLFTRHRRRLALNALGVAALIQAEQMAFAASALSVLARTVAFAPRLARVRAVADHPPQPSR